MHGTELKEVAEIEKFFIAQTPEEFQLFCDEQTKLPGCIMSWAAVAGAAIGAVGSIVSADSGGDTSTASKEPWKKAQPWIEDNIKTGQALQNYYAQNPFNSIQQGALDNTLSDVNPYRNNIAPGLMGFANKLMGTNYQRGNATGTSTNNAGLLSGTSTGQSGAQGLLSSSGAFPTSFSVPAQQTSGVNFNALNPLYKDPNASTSTASAQPTDEDIAGNGCARHCSHPMRTFLRWAAIGATAARRRRKTCARCWARKTRCKTFGWGEKWACLTASIPTSPARRSSSGAACDGARIWQPAPAAGIQGLLQMQQQQEDAKFKRGLLSMEMQQKQAQLDKANKLQDAIGGLFGGSQTAPSQQDVQRVGMESGNGFTGHASPQAISTATQMAPATQERLGWRHD